MLFFWHYAYVTIRKFCNEKNINISSTITKGIGPIVCITDRAGPMSYVSIEVPIKYTDGGYCAFALCGIFWD